MKRVVSISLGSSQRNNRVETEILGEKFIIERIGTDGDMVKAIGLIRELDGKVDAFGMGGIDLYITAGQRRYAFRDAKKIARAARTTPIVDGTGLKNTLERRVVSQLQETGLIAWEGKRVFLVSGADRFGMAQALVQHGAQVIFGDLMTALGLPLPLTSLSMLERVAYLLAPLLCQLPFTLLYPTGKKQGENSPRFEKFYREADVIAGDFHLIWKYLPLSLPGNIVLTNTVTAGDVEALRERGVGYLVTTTPELNGRSFGTNVMEGVLVAVIGKRPEEITPQEYEEAIDAIGFKPRLQDLTQREA
ncbi:MAG: quinate 5-dehydrogenase [bacterium]|nr:quinate 5-dehydrogenase [Bacillota bacterium]HHW56058.1 quinate 5-dehydrogenase [Bacillota bacterium]